MTCIYASPTMGDAHVLVAVVSARGAAEVLVHRVGSRGLARGPALWFFVGERQDAQVCIHLCSPGMAQLRVCFVGTYGEAGWANPQHPLALRHFGVKRIDGQDGDAAGGSRIAGRY